MIALLGGTFNPPHQGHIQAGLDTIEEIGALALGLLPCNIPPHKSTPQTTVAHRISMLSLACKQNPKLYVEPIEINLPGPSYTVNTLSLLRQRHPERPICFLIGDDSLYTLPTWYQWQQLTDYCHLVVMRRPAMTGQLSDRLSNWLTHRLVNNVTSLHQRPSGGIYLAKSNDYSVSSTQLRNAIKEGTTDNDITKGWLHPDVLNYIKLHKLYCAE